MDGLKGLKRLALFWNEELVLEFYRHTQRSSTDTHNAELVNTEEHRRTCSRKDTHSSSCLCLEQVLQVLQTHTVLQRLTTKNLLFSGTKNLFQNKFFKFYRHTQFFVSVCVCVCVRVFVFVYTHTHTHIHKHTHTYIHTHTNSAKDAGTQRTQTPGSFLEQIFLEQNLQICVCLCLCACTYLCIYTHTYTHT